MSGDFKAGGIRHRLSIARFDLGYYGRRHHRWHALVRVLWNVLIRCHYSESCQECGRMVGLVWWAPDPLWPELVSVSGGGLLCPACFDTKGADAGYRFCWVPMVTSRHGQATTNWWIDPTRDALLVGVLDPDYFPDDKVRVPQPTWQRIRDALSDDPLFDGVPLATYPPENCASLEPPE